MIRQANKQKIEKDHWPPSKWRAGTGQIHEFLKVSYVLSESRKFIFIHVPKTAGMSIHRGVIDERVSDAVTYPDLTEPIFASIWDDFFKFAIVRNPWDRMVSCWKYNPAGMIPEGTSFSDFLINYAWDDQGDPTNKHWLDQTAFLGDDRETWTDYVGRFESLDESWRQIRTRIGLPGVELPHRNRTRDTQPENGLFSLKRFLGVKPKQKYRDHYNSQTRKIVAKKFERDIDVFRYRF